MMPRKIKNHSHHGNILYMMTSPRWLIQIREVKSTKFKRLVTVITEKLTSHLSVWCTHVLIRMRVEKQWNSCLNKRPMGPIAHLRKLFKSIIYFMRIEWYLIWTNLNPLHPRMYCAKFGWNWPSGSGKDF